MRIVVGVLMLLFGLKLLSSPLFNSFLAMKLDVHMDYRWLPSIAVFIFAVIVCVARIFADAHVQMSRHSGQDDDELDDLSEHLDRPRHERRPDARNHWR